MLSPDWDNLVLWQTFPSIIIFVMAQDWDNRVHGDLISINCYYLGACMLNIDLGLLRDVSCFCLCIVGWRCSNTSLMTITAAKGVKCLNR